MAVTRRVRGSASGDRLRAALARYERLSGTSEKLFQLFVPVFEPLGKLVENAIFGDQKGQQPGGGLEVNAVDYVDSAPRPALKDMVVNPVPKQPLHLLFGDLAMLNEGRDFVNKRLDLAKPLNPEFDAAPQLDDLRGIDHCQPQVGGADSGHIRGPCEKGVGLFG